MLFLDTFSISEPEQYYQYRSIIGDPLVYTLFLLEMWRPGELDYPTLTDLYWDGTSRNFDIPLKIRTSRLEGEVEFSGGFTVTGGRDGRICSYVVAVREGTTGLNYVAIGASYKDVPDGQVVDGGVVDFVVNFAAEAGQEYKVFVFYVDNRSRFDVAENISPYVRCGDFSYNRSCDCKRGVLTGPGGGVVPATPRFTVTPVTDLCDLNEASVCADL